MQNCYPFWKFDGLVSERRSLFWVREFAPFIIEKIPSFSRKWVRALIFALIGRGGGGGGLGAFYQSVYKAYVKISLLIPCVLCSFFMSSLLSNWRGFMDHIAWGHFTGTFIFVAITKDIITDRNQITTKHHRAPSQYKDRLIYVWRFPC